MEPLSLSAQMPSQLWQVNKYKNKSHLKPVSMAICLVLMFLKLPTIAEKNPESPVLLRPE